MRSKRALLGFFLLTLTGLPGIAQEGHPLSGTWHGEWQQDATKKAPVVMYLKWDSKNIVGAINPGPRAIPLKVATLDPSNWAVHFEGDGKDRDGKAIHVVIDGKIENLGSYNRSIVGTWSQNDTKGALKITRD